jgi:hypothetical protein
MSLLEPIDPARPPAADDLTVVPPGAAPRPAASRLAVFVTHGMGQQVPFATLDDLVTALRKDPRLAGTRPSAQLVQLGDQTLQRIALHLDDPDRDVHFYEGYWAPLTEGAVTLRDVVRFLFGAGLNGVRNSTWRFHRWTFGELRAYDIPVRTWVYLTVALMTVLGLASMNAVVALVSAARIGLAKAPWLGDALFADLTATLDLFLLTALAFGLSVLFGRLLRASRAGRGVRSVAGWIGVVLLGLTVIAANAAGLALPGLVLVSAYQTATGSPPARAPFWDGWLGSGWTEALNGAIGWILFLAVLLAVALLLGRWLWTYLRAVLSQVAAWGRSTRGRQQPGTTLVVLGALAVLIAVLAAEALDLFRLTCRNPDAFRSDPRVFFSSCAGTEPEQRALRLFLTWPVLLGVSAVVRFFLIQYVGDVAAYVSSHTVDRFADLRRRIQDAVGARAEAVYAAERELKYDGVILVGHSLGSVVTYDVLNRLINGDELRRAAGGRVYEVARRTRLLLTFGSPLDKTAFLFATQAPRMSRAREALATTVQPLIQSYDFRAMRWINIYSPWDIISGALNYYDVPGTPTPPAVNNRLDPEATTLLGAHTEYWDDPLLRETLAAELLASEPTGG